MTTLTEKVAEFSATIPDWQVADSLNQPDSETYGYAWISLPCQLIRDALLASREWLVIKHAPGNSSLSQNVRDAAETFIDTVTLQVNVDLPNANYRQVVMDTVTTLITAGLLSQETVDTVLLGHGRRPLSWAETNGIPVDARAVGLARGGQ